jgi:hypothetical protein
MLLLHYQEFVGENTNKGGEKAEKAKVLSQKKAFHPEGLLILLLAIKLVLLVV